MMGNSGYVQYGCGWCAPKGWRNFDASPTLRFERLHLLGRLYTKNDDRFPETAEFGDIVRGLPVASGSCKGVYCSHVLEHLSLEDFRAALLNTYKILQSGGVFRFVLPDLEYYVRQYIANPSCAAASTFMKETCLGYERRSRGLKGLITSWIGNSQHLWMWDCKSIIPELQHAGFSNIRRAYYNDSQDPKFIEVEKMERWENCLGIECNK